MHIKPISPNFWSNEHECRLSIGINGVLAVVDVMVWAHAGAIEPKPEIA